MKQYVKKIAGMIAMMFIFALYSSFILSHETIYQFIHPILFISIFLVTFGWEKAGWIFTLTESYLLDLYSTLPFGVSMATLVICVGVVSFLKRNILKQQAVYIYLLFVIIAGIVFYGVFAGIVFAGTSAGVFFTEPIDWKSFMQFAAIQTLSHVLIFSITYSIVRWTQKQFFHSS